MSEEKKKSRTAHLKKIKPGQVLNPLGGKLHDPIKRLYRRLTKEELAEVGSIIIEGNVDRLKEKSKDPNLSILQAWMLSIAIKGINEGDSHRFDTLLNRIVGRPQAYIELTGADGGPIQFGKLSDEELKAEIKRLEKANKISEDE